MSVSLKEIVNSAENLVTKIYEKRDFILKQINGKECVSSAQMCLLLNSFVDQIVESKDIKPDPQLVRDCYETDQHKRFKDIINREKEVKNDLEIKIENLKNDLKLETSHKNNFEKLYNSSLIINLKKEIELKAQINELKVEIESYKELAEKLKNEKKNEAKDELRVDVKEELNEELIEGSDEDSEEESDEDSEEESDEDQRLRQLCLKSKPFVKINNIEIIKEVINLQKCSDTEEEIDSEEETINENGFQNGIQNGSEINIQNSLEINISSGNEDSDNETVVEEVLKPKMNKSSTNGIEMSDKYSKIETRTATKYVCSSKKCKYFTHSEPEMCQHIKKHENSVIKTEDHSITSKGSYLCQFPDCGKSYTTKSSLNIHVRNKHIFKKESKRQVRKAPKRHVNRHVSKSIKRELIEDLVHLY